MIKYVKRLLALIVVLIFTLPTVAQTTEVTMRDYMVPHANIAIPHPTDWIGYDLTSDFSRKLVEIYALPFDRESGQQPRDVVIRFEVVDKLDDETLEDALLRYVDSDEPLDPIVVEHDRISMLRVDSVMVGNVALAQIIIDGDEDSWLYLSIMNADIPIVTDIVANISYLVVPSQPTEAVVEDNVDETDETVASDLGDELPSSIVLEDASIEIFFPEAWIIDSTPYQHNLYESDFDRTSGQQPRSMVIEIQWFQKIPGETLDQAYGFLSGDATLEPRPVEDAQFDMLRADTTMVGNVTLEVVVVDAADYFVLLKVMKPNDLILDAMLAQIALAGAGDIECSVWIELIDFNGEVVVSMQARNGVEIDPLILDMTTVTVEQSNESTTYGNATVQIMSDGCGDVRSGSGLYDVVITEVGAKKINVIKAVRGLTGMGLADGKALVESAPNAIVLNGVSSEVAEAAKIQLETEGATVTLVELP